MLARSTALALAFALAWFGAPAASAADEWTARLRVEGVERRARVVDHRPDAAPGALVVMLHGGGPGNWRAVRRYTRYDALAAADGMVAVYPEGLDNGWNDGRTGVDGRALRDSDDVAFLAALIETLVGEGVADPGRVAVAGLSNGGMMSMRLVCERPDLVAAAAFVIANYPIGLDCPAGPPRPVLLLTGDVDPLVPPEGRRLVPTSGADRGAVRSVADTTAFWSARNGCDGVADAREIDRLDDASAVVIRDHLGCDAPFRDIVVQGGGHTLPGARAIWWLSGIVGPTSDEIDGARAIRDFFAETLGDD